MQNLEKLKTMKANFLLLLASAIWGFAFVAQKKGAEFLGPFAFTGIRFALGSLSLIPVMSYFKGTENSVRNKTASFRSTLKAGIITGLILFTAAALQQAGMTGTTAGKAGFITGLYIIFVPAIGILLKHNIDALTMAGVVLATAGMYLLCVKNEFAISYYDGLVLLCAFFWSIHIMVIDHFIKKTDALELSFFQFVTCSALSMSAAFAFEKLTVESVRLALIPLLYGGFCSVGIAYTLQVVGQKNAKPSHAAIILSMEAVFAAIGGFIVLGETLGTRALFGCALMLAGMLLPQIGNFKDNEKSTCPE
ncbi:MAG TPA: DMT family transporter [Candidatus Wallbacteria bacterium]|nr:DMT family transporter [Candidatus Wallbacteria bacterium]